MGRLFLSIDVIFLVPGRAVLLSFCCVALFNCYSYLCDQAAGMACAMKTICTVLLVIRCEVFDEVQFLIADFGLRMVKGRIVPHRSR